MSPLTSPSLLTSPYLLTGFGGGGSGTGNPTGIDESGYWANINNTRPTALQWLAVDLLTGDVLCALPGIVPSDSLSRTLFQYTSQTVTLFVNGSTSPSWFNGTRPMSTALIAYRGSEGPSTIVWGGIVLRRQRSVGSNAVTLTLATAECYLDRRYTGAYTTDPTDIGATRNQNTIISDLVTDFIVANQGLPVTVTTLSNGVAVPSIIATYNDYDDRTVYSNLGALNSLLDGPEWTMDWTWNQSTNTITPVLYVGNRIGSAVQAGLGPSVVFDGSMLIEGDYDENYSSGLGANDVEATGQGQGLSRPYGQYPSPPSTSLDGRPRVQYRYSPTTSIQDVLTLGQHAQGAWDILSGGTDTITLKTPTMSGPQLGSDWFIGDDVGWSFSGPAFPEAPSGVGRVIGYETADAYTTPTLYVASVS